MSPTKPEASRLCDQGPGPCWFGHASRWAHRESSSPAACILVAGMTLPWLFSGPLKFHVNIKSLSHFLNSINQLGF